MPTDFEFERKTYKGESDERRRKIRIKDDPTYLVEERKTAEERMAEKYPEGIDLSKARVERESDGTYILILANSSAEFKTDNPAAQTTASPSSGL